MWAGVLGFARILVVGLVGAVGGVVLIHWVSEEIYCFQVLLFVFCQWSLGTVCGNLSANIALNSGFGVSRDSAPGDINFKLLYVAFLQLMLSFYGSAIIYISFLPDSIAPCTV